MTQALTFVATANAISYCGADPVFIDRLKRISPFLVAVGKRLPTQAELEEAAFVRRELSVEIPRLDLELHRVKVERRVRPVQPDVPIDLSKLAMNLTTLPPVVPPTPGVNSNSYVRST